MRLLVDGTNVMGSRPDGWWRDRPGAARRLVAQIVAMRRAAGDAVSECTVVFDGRPLSDLPDGAGSDVAGFDVASLEVVVLWARRRGPDAADDRIVEWLSTDPRPSAVTVVTSDRRLAERARALGATVVGAGWLLDRLSDGFSHTNDRGRGRC